jgi:O-antigen ligase
MQKVKSDSNHLLILLITVYLLATLTRFFNLKVIQDTTSDLELSGTSAFVSAVGFLVLFVSLNYMVKNRLSIHLPLRSLLPVFVLFLWAQLSVLWSSNPLITEQRWLKVLIYVLIIINIFQTSSPVITLRKILYIFSWICAGSSLILILFFKPYGFINYGDGYLPCGIFAHKNGLGIFAASMILLIATTFVWPKQSGLKKLPNDYKILFCILFIEMVISKAMDVICGFIISIIIILLLQCAKEIPRKPLVFPLLFFGISSIILPVMTFVNFIDFTGLSNVILNAIGKDSTFSGRTDLWPVLLSIGIKYHLILGSGFGVFFIFMEKAGLMEYMNWVMAHAHNTYLQIFLELGIIGTVIILIMLISVFVNIFRFWKYYPIPASYLMGVYTLFIVQSIFESVLLRPCIMFFVFPCIICLLGSGIRMKESSNLHVI